MNINEFLTTLSPQHIQKLVTDGTKNEITDVKNLGDCKYSFTCITPELANAEKITIKVNYVELSIYFRILKREPDDLLNKSIVEAK